MEEIKVLIVDDHTLMRSGLKLMLANQADIRVIGEAADGEEALSLVAATQPDVVLLDVTMPGMSGLECLAKLRETDPSLKVILLTMHEDIRYLKEGFSSGAMGYVLKKAADDVLYEAIRTVCAGQVFMQANMAQTLFTEMRELKTKTKLDTSKPLSDQERRVLTLIALGHSNAEIAENLVVSSRTVETYKYRIMEKLDTKKRSDLVKYAMEQGLIKKD
ncbi:MAG: response regulator transcription factor [Negativicutes bacterium]|nr:response regulator transcription factor [Negativicutes bacterium]